MNGAIEMESSGLFEKVFYQAPEAMYVIDPETSRIVAVNPAGAEDLGMTPDEVLNESVLSLQDDVRGMPAWSEIVAVIREHDPYVFLGHHRRKDGSVFPVEVHTRCFRHGDREYLLSSVRDISQRLDREAELFESDAIRDFALNDSNDGLWDWHVATDAVYFSPQWKRMMGFGPDEVENHIATWERMVHPDDFERVINRLQKHLAGETLRYDAEYRLRNRSGEYFWVYDRGKVMERDAEGKPARVVGMVHDVTPRKELEHKLMRLARRDDLTGLANRREGYRFFEKSLKLARRADHELAICLVDVDHFKRINDRHGHLMGDRVLQEIAKVLTRSVRESDMVCRWGGEEFLVLLPDTSAPQALVLARRLAWAVAEEVGEAVDPELRVTLSGGISAYPAHGDDVERLIAEADDALYRAKERGRDQILLATD